MPISIQCDNCFETYRVADKWVGKTVRCKGCGTAIRIARDTEGRTKLAASTKARTAKTVAEVEEDSLDDLPLPPATKRRASKRVRQVGIWGEFLKIFRSAAPKSEQPETGFGFNDATAIVVIAVVSVTVQAVLGVRSASNPELFWHYYGSVIYLGLPALLVTWVLSGHLGQPETSHFVVFGWIVLALSAGIVATIIARALGIPPRIARLTLLFALAGPIANNRSKSQDVWRKHPIAMLTTVMATLAPLGAVAHFFHVSLKGQNIQARQALMELLPFIEGL